MTDLLAGQVQLKMDTYATSAPLIADGRLRALAIAGRARSALMPDVPTVAEMGVPGYEGMLWIGLMAPAGTPKPVIDKLAAAVRRRGALARDSPSGSSATASTGRRHAGGIRRMIAREIAQWRELAQSARIKLD